jgi:DNA-directed RNA polymerase subunit RPC12/RpoP
MDENRANLHPRYYEDLMEMWGEDTPLARRFIFGDWVEFATEQPFQGAWIRYHGDGTEDPTPNLSELRRCQACKMWALQCSACHSTFPMPVPFDPDVRCPHCGEKLLDGRRDTVSEGDKCPVQVPES